MNRRYSLLLAVLFIPAILLMPGCKGTGVFTPEPGEHIVIIGNSLADRMQHDGWLESQLQLAWPDHELVIRNQGFTGDRIDERPRSNGFPTAGDYLSHSGATAIFAMFGANEAWDDDPEGFRADLQSWLDSTLVKPYSDQGSPVVVLFSPIAHEDLETDDLPDGVAQNERLQAYADVVREVAEINSVPFVDLFAASKRLYSRADEPLTINGIHLTSEGNRQIAEVIIRELYGRVPSASDERLEAVRQAVVDKNWHWFNRYRATDGNDVWGSRSTLTFNDQTNFEVLQHELVQLDIMTANRDPVIWAAARGEELTVDDSNVPPPVPVESNLDEEQIQNGVSKVGQPEYLTPDEAMAEMELQDGLEVNLFASEEMFPELVNPVQLGVDTKGRMWAATWGTYPKWEPTKSMDDRLVILPDEDRDGVADTLITFAHVHNPTGFEFWNGGVLVASPPNIIYLKDTDGDDVADVRIPMMGAIGSADTHHSANNFMYGPDGFLYYQRGVFNVSNVETPWGPPQQSDASAMYRWNPRTHAFSYHAANPPNAHGSDFDYWGYHYATDATGGRAYQVKTDPAGTFHMRKLLDHTVRPVPSSGILSSAHLGPEFEGNFIILNVIAFLGVKQYTLDYDLETGNVSGSETADLLRTDDLNFRPSDFEIGDDGGLYISDWANAIIGHMQHNIRDPNRDHEHGRIYRITRTGAPLSQHVPIDGRPVEELLEALEHPINGIRRRARVELSERDKDEVIAATDDWILKMDPSDPDDAHHLLEALWVHQQFNVENRDLLALVMSSPEPHARIAGRNVQIMWNADLYTPETVPATAEATADSSESDGRPMPPDDAIVIRTVTEEMRYDTPSFQVKPGEEVTIWFQNDDFMPHNLVVGEPGSFEEIGAAADALGADGFNVQFIPESDRILAFSDLIEYEGWQVLTFTAPDELGVYDVLCTFPGHRHTMNAKMWVIE
jgi:azurin/lysophospholipase L1-like esterase